VKIQVIATPDEVAAKGADAVAAVKKALGVEDDDHADPASDRWGLPVLDDAVDRARAQIDRIAAAMSARIGDIVSEERVGAALLRSLPPRR
jgi:hypothetical protein